ncbi:uncharacterized protein LOC127526339 [Erpetoichthys calabaricus]|uniref:uncharacterized protein LOC127526339 n=1 Tax=Erpetoichthys calabaricus TaxID=27687 RepID=UPI0022341958|nr:uncharacterized protein LOC127526339 [Erpetoichthys calabaricus]
MDVKEETCEADLNIIKLRIINVKEEDCEWESVHPKQESLDIKEEDRELVSVKIKEEDEEKCVSTEIHNYRSLESVEEDDLHYGHQDGAVTGLVSSQSRRSSSPESSINVKYESLQSDRKTTEEISSPRTEEDQPSPKKSSKTKTVDQKKLEMLLNMKKKICTSGYKDEIKVVQSKLKRQLCKGKPTTETNLTTSYNKTHEGSVEWGDDHHWQL